MDIVHPSLGIFTPKSDIHHPKVGILRWNETFDTKGFSSPITTKQCNNITVYV